MTVHSVSAGVVAWLFAVTGPVAIILSVARAGDLGDRETSSWIFGAFVFNGVLTIITSWLYQQPLAFFWTIPGAVVVGTALIHLPWSQVLGAFLVTGVLMTVLGLSGHVRDTMALLPMPIVMAMVAGVFLKFGVELFTAMVALPWVVVPMTLAYLIVAARPRLAHWVPPVLGALVVGMLAVLLSGAWPPLTVSHWIVRPELQAPQFTAQALLELVVPLAITVLVVQNGQGRAVLTEAGHHPPMNVITIVCGIWSVAAGAVGAVSTCLAGPANALLVDSGERRRQYTGAIVCGVLSVAFGILAPVTVRIMLAAPAAFIAAIAGLAMLQALRGAFVTAFAGRFTFGALVCLLVTISNITVLNISSAFWGIVAGLATTATLERSELREHVAGVRHQARDRTPG
ncbi:MAG: benzoate/H(+) symporter BenE family transporter [Tetrasphaera sp.]